MYTQKRVWISKCPGEEVIGDIRCEVTGTDNATLSWTQVPEGASCQLNRSSTYYLNVQAINVPQNGACREGGGCRTLLNLYNNGQP